MSTLFRKYFLTLLFLGSFLGASDWQVNTFPPSDKILKNPKSGFTFMPRLDTVDKFPDWLLDLSTTAYFRLPWDEVVNEKGEYDFDRLDAAVFSGFRKRGLRLALRIMPANRFSPKSNIFPKETRGKGIPFIKVFLSPDKPTEIPIFWSEAYLQEHGRLMEALGAWLEKHPEVDCVDLGGMGEFGENHLNRWTEADKIAAGYTEAVFVEALFRMMEQAERHLPRVAKAFCVHVFRLLTERAVRHGWWLRTDSLTDRGPNYTVIPFFERYRGRTSWILEPSGGINRDFFGGPIPLTKYFEAVRKYQPSVANLMTMSDLGKLKPEEQQFLAEEGRRIGYRVQIQKAVLPKQVALRSGESPALPFSLTLAQNGAVPFNGDAVYQLRFAQEGKVVLELPWIPDEALSTLLPGQKRGERLYISLPKNFPVKPTRLSLAIKDLRHGFLRPDNAEVESDYYVALGSFELSSGGTSGLTDILPAFAKITPTEGMELLKSSNGLILKGREEKGWSYAALVGPPIKPGFIHVMKVEVRAWKSQIADSKLRFKIGVRKPGEASVRNHYTEPYDFGLAGEWQELTLSYQPKEPEEIGMFGVEKGRITPSTLNAEFRSWTLEARPVAPLD